MRGVLMPAVGDKYEGVTREADFALDVVLDALVDQPVALLVLCREAGIEFMRKGDEVWAACPDGLVRRVRPWEADSTETASYEIGET